MGRRLQFSSSKEDGTQLVWTYILLLKWYIYNGIGHNFCKLKTPSPVKFWHKIYNITKKKKPDNIKGHNKLSTIAMYWYCKKQCDQRGWMTWAFPIEVQCRGIPAQIWLKVSEAEKIRQKFRFWAFSGFDMGWTKELKLYAISEKIATIDSPFDNWKQSIDVFWYDPL